MQSFYELSKRIYDMKNPREARRALIFCVRAYFRRAQMRELDLFFRKDQVLTALLDIYPFVYEQPTRAFFYNKSTFDERTRIVESHMLFLREHVQKDVFLGLYRRENVRLWSGILCMGEQMTASLFFDYGQRKEGLMSVILRLGEAALYQIIFWIAPGRDGLPAMWIGAMQGPNMAHARDVVKQATKACHSYRTKNLVLYIAQAAARTLGLRHIYAVTNMGYYANNHVRIDRKLKTDFSAFWHEAGGIDTDDARFMELPLIEARKTMEEVPTRKRAVYRRRFALLDEIDREVTERVAAILR